MSVTVVSSSLREYAVVHQDRLRVELYRREKGGWQGYVLSRPDDVVESSCLELALSLAQIYAGVTLPSGIAEPEATGYAELEV